MTVRRASLASAFAAGLWLMLSTASSTHAQFVRPPELNVQFHRAETAWRSGGSVLEAKARVDRVLRELPDDVEARKLRAEVLLAMNRSEEALADALYAVRLRPEDAEAQLILCEAARLSGERTLAIQALDAAAERVSENAPMHVRLSWNAVELGQLDRAEAFARIALALKPNEAAAYQQLARVFVLQNREQEAVEILVRGLRSSILRADVLERDPVLSHMIGHPAIAALVRR